MTQFVKKEKEDKWRKQKKKLEEAEDAQAEANLQMPSQHVHRFPELMKVLDRVSLANWEASPEQRKRFRQFIQLVRKLPEPEPEKIEIEEGALVGKSKDGSTAPARQESPATWPAARSSQVKPADFKTAKSDEWKPLI